MSREVFSDVGELFASMFLVILVVLVTAMLACAAWIVSITVFEKIQDKRARTAAIEGRCDDAWRHVVRGTGRAYMIEDWCPKPSMISRLNADLADIEAAAQAQEPAK